jgi:hypothetical protein
MQIQFAGTADHIEALRDGTISFIFATKIPQTQQNKKKTNLVSCDITHS